MNVHGRARKSHLSTTRVQRERFGKPVRLPGRTGVCRLFELQESGTDYVLVMEHHGDIVLLDSSDAPTAVDCYQVKTADSHWSIEETSPKVWKNGKGELDRREDVRELHYLRRGNAGPFNFVSNYAYKVKLKCGTKSRDRRRSPSVNSKPL